MTIACPCASGFAAGNSKRRAVAITAANEPSRLHKRCGGSTFVTGRQSDEMFGSWPGLSRRPRLFLLRARNSDRPAWARKLLVVMRVIPERRSEAEASPESTLPDLGLWIPGSRPAAEPRNDWTTALPERASSVRDKALARKSPVD